MHRLLGLAACLLLWSCVRQQPGQGLTFNVCERIRVVPAQGTTPAQLASVDSALSLWNAWGLSRLTLQDASGAALIPLRFDVAPDAFHGVYEANLGDIVINQDMQDPQEVAVVVAHELGHAMGLSHVSTSTRPSVMNPDNLVQPPTAGDEAALAAQWGSCAASPP